MPNPTDVRLLPVRALIEEMQVLLIHTTGAEKADLEVLLVAAEEFKLPPWDQARVRAATPAIRDILVRLGEKLELYQGTPLPDSPDWEAYKAQCESFRNLVQTAARRLAEATGTPEAELREIADEAIRKSIKTSTRYYTHGQRGTIAESRGQEIEFVEEGSPYQQETMSNHLFELMKAGTCTRDGLIGASGASPQTVTFVLWQLRTAGYLIETDDDGYYHLTVPGKAQKTSE